jgi:aminoglycoside/choline kinase family phosphotransferase
MQDTRFELLKLWLKNLPSSYGLDIDSISAASSDASFRRYFRVLSTINPVQSYIVMDAPVDKEDTRPFIHVAKLLWQANIDAPQIYEENLNEGFLLLSDLGNQTLLQRLNPKNAFDYYQVVNRVLVQMQKNTPINQLPLYDEALLQREMHLFPDWYLNQHVNYLLNDSEKNELESIFSQLVKNNLSQPQLFVHRDFHSRNLMVTNDGKLGVIDFQDAVIGPITYDLVSIYRDAYISWEEEQQMDWVVRYWELAKKEQLPVNQDFGEFYRDFEWMGLQRHLKVLGIFARLYHRDGKDGYLKDIPLVLNYAEKVAGRYSIFKPLLRILDKSQNKQRPDGLTF